MVTDINSQAQFSQVQSFADMQRFTELRAQARDNPEATMGEVAAQFESIFVQMMMTSMRDASVPLESGLFSSNQSKMYEKMMDQQLSMNISANGGLGLAEIIERQISPPSGIQEADQSSGLVK